MTIPTETAAAAYAAVIAFRTSATTASGSAGFSTYETHPAAFASRDASSDAWPVMATTGMRVVL